MCVSLTVTLDDSSECRTQHDRAEATGTDTEAENGRGDACPQPENHHQCHHATKVEGEKAEAGRESSPGSRAGGKKAQARQALSIYLNLPTLDEAVNILKPRWPGLFDGDTPRLLACGIRDVLLEDVAQRNIPLSHKKLRRALKAITRSESYLCAMKAGACRYDTEGYVTEHISQEEEAYAAARLDKIRRQNRIKAELQAVLDETIKKASIREEAGK